MAMPLLPNFRPLLAEEIAAVLGTPKHILALCAIDENYAMPLAVMLRSAASNLSAGRHLHVLLIDGGITPKSQEKLGLSLANLPITIHAIIPDYDVISDLMISHHATHSVYLRLLAGLLLPQSIDRIIYLDADMIVQGDIAELWEYPLGDHYCLAVPDIACPHIAAQHSDSNFAKSGKYLVAEMPVRNWKELGLDPAAPYFNSGVMVLNLSRWREEKIEKKLLSCLQENEEFIFCWDQYALNVVFSGNWGKLPARWNQGAHIFQYPGPEYSPIPAEDFIEMRDKPAIIHFTTQWKPWQYNDFHPLREQFLEAMDQTEFGGWRPQKPRASGRSILRLNLERVSRFCRSPRAFSRRNARRASRQIRRIKVRTSDKLTSASEGDFIRSESSPLISTVSYMKTVLTGQTPKILMYVHVPKCAGTTLVASFARLGRARHLNLSWSEESKSKAMADLKTLMADRLVNPKELAAVSGHDVFIGLHEVTELEPIYATILREPVARYISHYRFFVDCALDENHPIHADAKGIIIEDGQPISLEKFTDRKLFTNTMATYLAAANHPDRESNRASLQNPDEIVELASGCLRRMDFIGLVEEFPADLAHLCSLAGIPPAPASNKSVHTLQSDECSDDLIQKILANNTLDIEIYRLATELRVKKLGQLL